MFVWLALAAVTAWLLWFMVSVPGASWSGAPRPANAAEREIEANLHRYLAATAGRERNLRHPAALEASARAIESALAGMGYAHATQRYEALGVEVRNIEVQIAGSARAEEIVLVGAHYDSVEGSPGGNDNGSGVAALMELARLLRDARPARTLRFVWFVNEEPPYFEGEAMGSRRYARRARELGERIAAMFSLETLGWYSDAPGSQRYPFPLGFFYPSKGEFVAFVANLGSRSLLHESLAAFRRHAEFPSEGVAAPAFLPGVAWSDHASFWEQGYPALMITDTALYRYPWYHSPRDTADKVDYPRLARVVRGIEAMLRELAAAARTD